jgi:mono/diheme cytochrome c family protein
MSQRLRRIIVLFSLPVAILLVAAACTSEQATDAPEPTPTETAEETPEPTPTEETEAPTPEPTPTAEPEPTPTEEAEPTPTEETEPTPDEPDPELVALGESLFSEFGCTGCHGIEGQVVFGPPLNNLFGRETTLDDGTTIEVDEEYVRQKLTDPAGTTVDGFPAGAMNAGIGDLLDQIHEGDNLDALIAYLHSLDDEE